MTTLELPVNEDTLVVREKLFTTLYKNAFPIVARFIAHHDGTFQDAKDIFQDTLIIYYEKLKEEQFEPRINETAYLAGIAKHLWFQKFNREKQTISLADIESEITVPPDFFPKEETNKLLTFLELTGKKCLDLLSVFYYHKQSMNQIAHSFGFSGERSATVQKYKCIEKIRDQVKSKAMTYEDFVE
jgi:DNA-directed RNA polymerase specialized sigma24 family protein